MKKARVEFLGHLKEWTKAMDEDGPYFAGWQISMPDLVLAPWAVRLWPLDEFKGGVGIPEPGEGGEDEAIWKRWRVWVRAMEERRSMRETMSDREHFRPLYKR